MSLYMSSYQDDSHLLLNHIHCNKCKHTIKDIKREELKQPVSVERGKELFANMRRELGLDETISYKEFFDL